MTFAPPPELELALRLAELAAREAMSRYEHAHVEYKADGSEVTDADKAAEEGMRALLAKEAPHDTIVGEEHGGKLDPAAERAWIIDPIDGTASFVLGVPLFGTLVALVERGKVLTGVIGFPALKEQTVAQRGHGCWHLRVGAEPRRVQVAPRERLAEAYASSTGPHYSDMLPPGTVTPRYGLSALAAKAGRFRMVPDCLQHSFVCRGRLQVAVDTRMALWDIAALVPCVEEAGGRVSGADGSDVVLGETLSLVSSCGGPLHDEVTALLAAGG